jgi:hypothetical protein
MLKRWQQTVIIIVSLMLTLWIYELWNFPPEILNQPSMTPRFNPVYTDPAFILVCLLILLLLGSWLVPDYLAKFAWMKQHPNTLKWAACVVMLMIWLVCAYGLASGYAFYYGNTWRYHEIFMGFVLLEPKALTMALIFTVICWLSIRAQLPN